MSLPPGPQSPVLYQIWQYTYRNVPFLSECARRYGDVFTVRMEKGRPLPVVRRQVTLAPAGGTRVLIERRVPRQTAAAASLEPVGLVA